MLVNLAKQTERKAQLEWINEKKKIEDNFDLALGL